MSLKEELLNEIRNKRVPMVGTLMITSNCNFLCSHCYLKPERDKKDLSFLEWKKIIDTIKEKGTKYLTITGGEPLVNKDFIKIYNYCYDLNFKITLFTNLSLLNEEHIKLFKKKPPVKISITLYGFSDRTYSIFCKKDYIFNKIKDNILLLDKNKINFNVKTIANKANFNELKQMKEFCDSLNKNIDIYRKINCDVNNDECTKEYKLDNDQILQTYKIINDFENIFKEYRKNKELWENDYKRCDVGLSSFYINSEGEMYLCNKYYSERFSLLKDGFDKAWESIYEVRKRIIEAKSICSSCAKKYYCGKCSPHLLALKDQRSECVNILEVAQKLNIDKDKYSQYKFSDLYELVKVGSKDVLLPTNKSSTNKCIILNETSSYIIEVINKGYSLYELLELMKEKYNDFTVDKQKEVREFIDSLVEKKVIELTL